MCWSIFLQALQNLKKKNFFVHARIALYTKQKCADFEWNCFDRLQISDYLANIVSKFK